MFISGVFDCELPVCAVADAMMARPDVARRCGLLFELMERHRLTCRSDSYLLEETRTRVSATILNRSFYLPILIQLALSPAPKSW